MRRNVNKKSGKDWRFQSRCIAFLGDWTSIWTNKPNRACVRVLKSLCEERVRCAYRYALADAALFSSQMAADAHADVSFDKFLINGTHIVKKKKLSFRRRAMTSSSFREVVSAFFSVSNTRVLLIERTYLNSCLRLVRTKLSSRARMCLYVSLCVHAYVCMLCVYVLRCICLLFLFVYARVTLKFRVAKHLVSFHRYAISSLS